MKTNLSSAKNPAAAKAKSKKTKTPQTKVPAKATAKAKPPTAAKEVKSGSAIAAAPATVPLPPLAQRASKQSQVIASLMSASGVTLQQMMALTGWQAHTVRGTISAVLRKKLGLNVTCATFTPSGERLYRIDEAVAP